MPVSQITRKLPYYKAISKQLDDDSTIDMEAGVSAIVNNPLQMPKSKLKRKAESTEKQEEHSEEASQEQNQEQNPEGENSSGNE